jgi:hypothetical protein
MGKKALIHIGTGKTGTTSIQESLASQKRKLGGVGYPNIVGNAHHFLEVVYQQYSHLSRGHRSEYADEAARLKHAKILHSKFLKRVRQNKRIIISSEFLGRFGKQQVLALKSDLDDSGYTDYKVVCYVRDPVSYYRSLLQQKLKASHHPPNPRDFKYGFREAIENHRAYYGDKVLVRAYDNALYQGDIVRDFLQLAERFFKVDYSRVKSISANRSLSAEAMFILHRYRELYEFEKDNISTPKSNVLLQYLTQLPEIETSPIELHPGVEEVIRDRVQDELLWLKESCGIDFQRQAAESPLARKHMVRNFDLLENIIRKPADASIDQIKYDLIDRCLEMPRFIAESK